MVAVLRAPSSIIAHEHSYVLNTKHLDFAQVGILGREDFAFDPRIKAPEPGQEQRRLLNCYELMRREIVSS